MSIVYNLLHKKKDQALRQHPAYLGLADLGYSISPLGSDEFGISFEKKLTGTFA